MCQPLFLRNSLNTKKVVFKNLYEAFFGAGSLVSLFNLIKATEMARGQ
jgi:hypothetical protein